MKVSFVQYLHSPILSVDDTDDDADDEGICCAIVSAIVNSATENKEFFV